MIERHSYPAPASLEHNPDLMGKLARFYAAGGMLFWAEGKLMACTQNPESQAALTELHSVGDKVRNLFVRFRRERKVLAECRHCRSRKVCSCPACFNLNSGELRVCGRCRGSGLAETFLM